MEPKIVCAPRPAVISKDWKFGRTKIPVIGNCDEAVALLTKFSRCIA
jgi:hypothetical protein